MKTTKQPGLDQTMEGVGHGQIPHGVQDRILEGAARRRQAEAAVRDCAIGWGYQEVIPPTFEYHDNLSVGASERLQQAMYRFFDREGRMLALRADFTPQIARMAATKLFERPMPLRCFYIGSLYRCEEPQAGRKREFTQAGVELIGANTSQADAEVVALSIAALEALDLDGFQINLGQMAFFRALTCDLPAEALEPIREAIDQKNGARLSEALARAGIEDSRRRLLRRLPDLVGGPEVLGEARALSKEQERVPGVRAALERLGQVYDLLRAYGVASRIAIDLGEVRGMDYYTGITFRGVAPSLGWPVISGGRYDDLIAQFGRSMTAVGFGLGIERALLAQTGRETALSVAHVLVQGCEHSSCFAVVQRLRQMGCKVEIEVLGLDEKDVITEARRREIPRALLCSAGAWVVADANGRRPLDEDGLLRDAETWL